MPPTNKKPISKAYLNQLVNLYNRIIEQGEDLDYLLSSDVGTYNSSMDANIHHESSFKQHKVKLRALRKHSDVVEQQYRNKGKGSLSNLSKNELRKHSVTFLQFKPYPKETKPKAKRDSGLPKIPEPDGTSAYGTFEIYDSKTDEYYYIKYKNAKDFKNKVRKLKDSISKNLSYNFLGIDYYKSFVDKEFKKFVQTTLGV